MATVPLVATLWLHRAEGVHVDTQRRDVVGLMQKYKSALMLLIIFLYI